MWKLRLIDKKWVDLWGEIDEPQAREVGHAFSFECHQLLTLNGETPDTRKCRERGVELGLLEFRSRSRHCLLRPRHKCLGSIHAISTGYSDRRRWKHIAPDVFDAPVRWCRLTTKLEAWRARLRAIDCIPP